MQAMQEIRTEVERTKNERRLVDPLSRDLAGAESFLLVPSSGLSMTVCCTTPVITRRQCSSNWRCNLQLLQWEGRCLNLIQAVVYTKIAHVNIV